MSGPNPRLELTHEAQDDFRDIIFYTIETWGEDQALVYQTKLENCFQMIQNNPHIGHQRDDIFPSYRVLSIEKHLIIYWPTQAFIKVIRILHMNRDIQNLETP